MAITEARDVSTPAPTPEPPGAVDSPTPWGAPPASGRSPFPPIADYAFLSDCESTCLIAPSGAVEWMCVPRPDSPSVFAAVLDRGAGSFRVGPYGVRVPVARRYLPGSLVLETTWQTSTGWLVVRDAMVLGPWHNVDKRSQTHRRTPTDYDAEHSLVRTVTCINGSVELEVVCEPMPDYGRAEATWQYDGGGYSHLTSPLRPGSAGPVLKLASSLRLGIEGRRAHGRTRLTAGESAFVALGWSPLPCPADWASATEAVTRTERYWREWLAQGAFPDHPWRAYLQQSALTLKGLTYAPTGALLAAPTTSLPETPGGERNWDYRYAWIRDSTFALWGLYTLGLDREANDFFEFIHDVCRDNKDLQIMYGVGGEERLEEFELPNLSGYEGAQPVRVGNAAYTQRQHDVWGAVLDSAYLHARSREQLPESLWPILKRQVEEAATITGASRTGASGRCAASRGTSRPRRSCAGLRWTGAHASPGCTANRRSRRGGTRSRRRSRRTSWRTEWTPAAPSRSTTGRRRSTRPYSWCRSCTSCRRTTRACARRSWRSRTS